MVLLGIFAGIYSINRLETEQIRQLATTPHTYLIIALISLSYTFIFKRQYLEGGIKIDYPSTFLSSIWGVIKFILSYFLSMSFIVLISF